MSKFKVGDKFLVIDDESHYAIRNGDVVSLVVDDGTNVKYYEDKRGVVVCINDVRLNHIPDTTNTLQVGETYTSRNGSEWECIFVRDGKAWMIGVYPDGAKGSAYEFDIDGTASWAGGRGAEGYNIKWGPKRETKRHVIYANGEKRETEFDVVDGAVDWGSLRVLPCD